MKIQSLRSLAKCRNISIDQYYPPESYDTQQEEETGTTDTAADYEDTFYTKRGGFANRRGQYSGPSRARGRSHQPSQSGCRHCGSALHWISDCPDLKHTPPNRYLRGAAHRGTMRGGHRCNGNTRPSYNNHYQF